MRRNTQMEDGYVFFEANVFDNGWLRIEPCYKGGKYYFRVENRDAKTVSFVEANDRQTQRIKKWKEARGVA